LTVEISFFNKINDILTVNVFQQVFEQIRGKTFLSDAVQVSMYMIHCKWQATKSTGWSVIIWQ